MKIFGMSRSPLPGGVRILMMSLSLVMVFLSGCGEQNAPENERDEAKAPAEDFYSLIKSTDRLVLSEMTINKIGSVEDLRLDEAKGNRQKWEALKNVFKIGTRKGAYSYNTYLQAYMDMNEFGRDDVSVDTVSRIMTIRLPRIKTEFAGRDVEVKEEHYRVSGLRSNISAEERAAVKEAMNEALKREVKENSGFERELMKSARQKAIAYFTTFAAEKGYKPEITIKE